MALSLQCCDLAPFLISLNINRSFPSDVALRAVWPIFWVLSTLTAALPHASHLSAWCCGPGERHQTVDDVQSVTLFVNRSISSIRIATRPPRTKPVNGCRKPSKRGAWFSVLSVTSAPSAYLALWMVFGSCSVSLKRSHFRDAGGRPTRARPFGLLCRGPCQNMIMPPTFQPF